MHFRELLTEAAIPAISLQQASDGGMFGPLYHGTQGDLSQIIATGFDQTKAMPSGVGGWRSTPVGTSNGYAFEPYGSTGIAPPIHHLGFGSYFTTSKSIAKQYAGGTMKGMRTFYLDSQRITTINFGAPNTMMRWWREHGYDMTSEATKALSFQRWQGATIKLTLNLQRDNDAVWFKGKGMYRLLDGDQVCVYNTDLIRVIDPKLSTGIEVGAKITHTQVIAERYNTSTFYVDDLKPTDFGSAGRMAGTGWRGVFRIDTKEPRYPIHMIPPPKMTGIITKQQGNGMFSVKWAKGGEMYNYVAEELQPK